MHNPKLLRKSWDKIYRYTLSFKTFILLFLLFSNYCVSGQTAGSTETYTSNNNRIIPPGVTNITVGIWGGGGAGGGCSANNNNSGGGGAGGSYTYSVLACNPFDSVYIIVGAGGSAVSAGAGGAGGFSRVTVRQGVIISSATANGGLGGALGSGNNGAGAGAATTIGVTHNGGAGAAGTGTGGGASGGGGGGAGSGGSGSNANASIGGIGGIGVTSGGNGANGSSAAANGTSATTLSGGGAGARNGGGGVARAGGNGFRGQVIIFYGGCDDGTLLLTSAMGTDNQNFCLGSDLVDITYSVGGDATGASLSAGAFPDGVLGSFNAGIYTITGTPTEFGVFNYTISTTGSNPCNEASVNGTITVLEVPQAAFATVSDITVSCETVPTGTSLSYTNNNISCPISGNVVGVISGGPSNICGATFTETWTFTDQFGRMSNQSRNIVVSAAPLASFSMPLPQDITIDCASGVPDFTPLSYSNGLTGICEISGTANSVIPNSPYNSCGFTYGETWIYTDVCNRQIIHVRAITIDDNIAPSITLLGMPNITISPCTFVYNDAGATAVDNCLGDITNDIVVNNPLSAMQPFAYVPGVYTITYDVSDNCTNMATQVTRTVTVSPYATKADGNYGSLSTWEGECVPPNPIPNGVTVNITHNLVNFGTLTNNGIISSSLPFTNEGIYQGNGTFQGPEFINNGNVNPGN